jgi:6-pyruvoyltetrahydropterin/6-carboxytetrahydropterin synthase
MEVFVDFTIAAARYLPHVAEGHPCGRMHGHTFDVRVVLRGPVDPQTGWVADFADVESAWKPIHGALDHRTLNDVPGLENPTSEHLAQWCWRTLAPALPLLARIEVRESGRYGCVYDGTDGR